MDKSIKIARAIKKINPNANAKIIAEDINQITWLGGTTPISKADIQAKMDEIDNEPKQSNYAEQRRNAYPPIGDQLDMLWHSIDQNPELKQKYFNFYEAIKQVKVKYPKNG